MLFLGAYCFELQRLQSLMLFNKWAPDVSNDQMPILPFVQSVCPGILYEIIFRSIANQSNKSIYWRI